MDSTPFLEFDVLNIKETLAQELKRFCKANFNIDEIFSRASELKYSSEIKKYFTKLLNDPSDDFVKFMILCCFEGVKTGSIVEKFRPIVKTSLNSLISEMMNERITTALKNEASKTVEAEAEILPASADDESQDEIMPTEDEFLAYKIIKAILAEHMDISEITYKDTVNYFAILYKGMATKWICRFRLGSTKDYISLPNDEGKETRTPIQAINDIYKFKDAIIASAKRLI